MALMPTFVPPLGAVAQVSMIDTGVRLVNIPITGMMQPAMNGFPVFEPMVAWSFLVESSKGQKAIFDLSIPPGQVPPAAIELLTAWGGGVTGSKHVADILIEHDVDPAEIETVIWSHRM